MRKLADIPLKDKDRQAVEMAARILRPLSASTQQGILLWRSTASTTAVSMHSRLCFCARDWRRSSRKKAQASQKKDKLV
jgi:hypothetical protein